MHYFHRYHHGHAGIGLFMLTSIGLTIPFLCIMKRIANSLEILAEKKL